MIAVKQMFRCEIEQQRSLFKIPCFADISFHPDFLLHGLFTCVFCGKCKYVYNKTPQGIFKVKENVATVSYDEFQKLVNKAKSLLHTTFYVQLLTLKSKHFTVTLEVKREVYREMELSQVTYRGSWISANLVAEEKEEGELADRKKEMARRHSSEKEENVAKQKRQRTEVWWGGRGNNNKVSGVNSAVGCPE